MSFRCAHRKEKSNGFWHSMSEKCTNLAPNNIEYYINTVTEPTNQPTVIATLI